MAKAVVRELASENSNQIAKLQEGTVVSVVEKLTNNWYKIDLNDSYGYAIIEDKSDEKPDDKPETKISVIGVTTTSLNVRTEPDTNISTNIIGVLSQDTKIEIVEEVNDFYKIKYKGQYAYVAKSYVSVKQNMKLDKVADLKLTTDVVVRELASDTSDSIFTLKQGTKVTVVENFLNGWYKIYVNNIYGYRIENSELENYDTVLDKVLSNEKMDEIYHKVDEQIDKVINNIENSNFDINPKNYNGKNISCTYCKFKDICYKSIKDEVIIETEDNDGVDC